MTKTDDEKVLTEVCKASRIATLSANEGAPAPSRGQRLQQKPSVHESDGSWTLLHRSDRTPSHRHQGHILRLSRQSVLHIAGGHYSLGPNPKTGVDNCFFDFEWAV